MIIIDKVWIAKQRAMRKIREVSNKELAAMLGVSASLISQWESGRIEVSEEMRLRIIEALGFTPAAMFHMERVLEETEATGKELLGNG